MKQNATYRSLLVKTQTSPHTAQLSGYLQTLILNYFRVLKFGEKMLFDVYLEKKNTRSETKLRQKPLDFKPRKIITYRLRKYLSMLKKGFSDDASYMDTTSVDLVAVYSLIVRFVHLGPDSISLLLQTRPFFLFLLFLIISFTLFILKASTARF